MLKCVLLSIKPEFAEQIFNGSKRYEYRRTLFKNKDVIKIIVYASSPVQKIVGELEIADILSLDIKRLWESTKQYAGIDKKYFDKYFHGKEMGHAIKIKNAQLYRDPLELKDACNIKRPPQSFMYLNSKDIACFA